MIEYTQIKSLPDWLDESENKINYILQKGKREAGKERLNNFFPIRKSIKIDISQRDSCFKLYQNLISTDFDDLLSKIKINSETFKYYEIRHQLFIPLLSLNTRIYEKCINLCYLLNTQSEKSFRLSEIFLSDFSKKFNLKNEINKLTQEYGYCLSLIVFFRNQFIHSGEYSNPEENFFISNDHQFEDILNLKVVEKAYDQYKDKNKNKKLSLLKNHFNLSENIDTKAGEIIKKCANISDHYMGCLIGTIIHEKWKNK